MWPINAQNGQKSFHIPVMLRHLLRFFISHHSKKVKMLVVDLLVRSLNMTVVSLV
jgi:hypothetical protein